MYFPKNPKVLVVDDRYDEVEPLLRLFSQNGTPYVYFDGKDFPETPFTSIRLVILDINLDSITHGLDNKSKASALANYLSKLITIKESYYAILFWTRHKEIIKTIVKYLRKNNAAPVMYKNMDKPTKEEMTLNYVKEKFLADLNSTAFEFLINWEEDVSHNTTNFTNKLVNIVKQEAKKTKTNWDSAITHILAKFTCTYTGKTKIEDSISKEQAITYATRILNKSFAEDLAKNLQNQCTNTIKLPSEPIISLKTIAKLNEILFIENTNDKSIEIGKVFFKRDKKLYELLKKKILTQSCQNSQILKTRLIATILTPSCDLAHKKFLNFKSSNDTEYQYHRVLYGLKILICGDNINTCFEYNASAESNKNRINKIIDMDINITTEVDSCISANNLAENYTKGELETLKNKIRKLKALKEKIKKCVCGNKPEYLYFTQPFLDEHKKIALFVFHFGTIQTIQIDPATIKFSYLMKNSLISDLQTKLANHVNRLVNNMLEYKS